MDIIYDDYLSDDYYDPKPYGFWFGYVITTFFELSQNTLLVGFGNWVQI